MLAAIYKKKDNLETELYEVVPEPVYVAPYTATSYDEVVAKLKQAYAAAEKLTNDSLVGIAYEMADGAIEYENSSYAVLCIEWDPIRMRWDYWHEEEIPDVLPEEIIYW